jgi:hypothetical protein
MDVEIKLKETYEEVHLVANYGGGCALEHIDESASGIFE